jgi:hypothetical protein
MPNILTKPEAANVLRTDEDDLVMIQLLESVDRDIEYATGRNWTLDDPIEILAKNAAMILITRYFENPGMIGAGLTSLEPGLRSALVKLEARALELLTDGVPDEALKIVSSIPAQGADEIAITITLVIIFNNQLASTSEATLEDGAGNGITITNSLDATNKILSVNPDSNLTADTTYKLILTAIPDIYGQTLTKELDFRTA